MKKTVLLAGFILLSAFIFSQEKSLNEYKYVVVPSEFSFLKKADQFQLNSLTKFLFNKYGFQTILDSEQMPKEAETNNCLVLRSNVLKEKSFLKTKLLVELKNCRGEVVYISREGTSREKDYKKAYHEALRDAFTSFNSVGYKYAPIKKESGKETVIIAKVDNEKDVVNDKPTKDILTIEENKEKVSSVEENEEKGSIEKVNVLYAQRTNEGYQLVDTSPKVVYILLETNLKDVFIVKNKNAIIYKEDNRWFLSYSEAETNELNIKF